MSKLDVELYKFDDWHVLLVDGEIVDQGHKITPEDLVAVLPLEDVGINFRSQFIDEADYPELKELFEESNVEEIIKEIR